MITQPGLQAQLAARLRRETKAEVLFSRADRGRYATDALWRCIRSACWPMHSHRDGRRAKISWTSGEDQRAERLRSRCGCAHQPRAKHRPFRRLQPCPHGHLIGKTPRRR